MPVEKGPLDKFFDFADELVDGVGKVIVPTDETLWRVDDVLDERGTVYVITNGYSKLETQDYKLAQRVCYALNG